MARITINLLPSEFRVEELKRNRFHRIQIAGVVIMLVMFFLTSLTVTLRVLQSSSISEVRAKVAESEQKVSEFKSTQASLLLLKNRLSTIDQYLGVSSQQTSIYQLIDKLIPPSVVVGEITIDRANQVIIQALLPDSAALDSLLNNLTSKEQNGGGIKQISIENLSRGRDGSYRVSFKVK